MSFGFGVGDIAAAINLAHTVYKKCRDSPNQYKELAADAQQLANILEDLDDLVKECQLKPSKERRLLEYGHACRETLDDANKMLDRYKNMSAKARGVVNRLGWDYEDARDIRDRMTNNKISLSAFYSSLTMSEFVQMQKNFVSYLDEVRKGHRDTDSVVLIATQDESNERSAWPVLIKELEDFGLTSDVVNRNRQFIVELIRTAFDDGRLENISIGEDDLSRALENISLSQTNDFDTTITDGNTNQGALETQAIPSQEEHVPHEEEEELSGYQEGIVEKPATTEDRSLGFNAEATINVQPASTSEWSETQSLMSSMSTTKAFQHPHTIQPGLHSSIIEVISVWLKFGKVTKAAIMGELALSYSTSSTDDFPAEANIRLENVHELAVIAANPMFVTQAASPNDPREYVVKLSSLAGAARAPTVAFKYQVGLYEDDVVTQAPIILIPQWKCEDAQTSVILRYTMNPVFTTPITLSDVRISIRLELNEAGAGQATTARAKPEGTFSRLHNMIWWQFEELLLKPDAPDHTILARLATSGQARPGNVEASWKLAGESSSGLGIGSRLNVSQLDMTETLSDSVSEHISADSWKSVRGSRKITSGTYVAT